MFGVVKNKFLFIVLCFLFIYQAAFSQNDKVFESEFTVSSKVLVSDLKKSRFTVCENKEYFNNEDKICLSVGSDFEDDGSLFLSDVRFHIEELKEKYDLEVTGLSIDINEIAPDLNTFVFKPTVLNSYLHNGKLKTNGYIQYSLGSKNTEVFLSIKLSLGAKLASPKSLEHAVDAVNKENKYIRIKSIVKSNGTRCFLTLEGRVKCIGSNVHGKLGIGKSISELRVIQSMSESEYIDFGTDSPAIQLISLGSIGNAFCALFDMGQVKCWGENNGKLGIGVLNKNFSNIGDDVDELKNIDFIKFSEPIQKLYTNKYTICGLTTEKNLKCWRANNFGILGQNISGQIYPYLSQNEIENMPYIDLGNRIRDVLFVGATLCAVLENDTVMCWGANSTGLLGQGTSNNSINQGAVPISELEPIPIPHKRIVQWGAIGLVGLCVLFFDGELYCWGVNRYGVLGQGSHRQIIGDQPGDIQGLKPIVFESKIIKFVSIYRNICVLLESGSVMCWGRYSDVDGVEQSLGDEPEEMKNLRALSFNTTRKAVDIISAGRVICVDFSDGARRCFGGNQNYELGQGIASSFYGLNKTEAPLLSPIFDREKVDRYFLENGINCILNTSGQIKCIGFNNSGILGLPQQIRAVGKEVNQVQYLPLGELKIKNLLNFDSSLCVVYVTDQVKCWGANFYGSLGIDAESSIVGGSMFEIESLDYLKY